MTMTETGPTLNGGSWPAAMAPPPPPAPAKKSMSVGLRIFFGVLFVLFAGGVVSSIADSAHSSGTSSSGYSYSYGDYPNGWTQGDVDDAITGLVRSGVSTSTGGCLLRYVVDHYTPSEMLAADATTVARRAHCY